MSAPSAPTAVQRVALVASSARQLADLAPPLIARLLQLRHRPICLAPAGDPERATSLIALGAVFDAIELPPVGLGLFAGFGAKGRLAGTLKSHRPHALIAFDLASAATVAPMAQRAGCLRMLAALATGDVSCSEDGEVSVQSAAGAQLRAVIAAGAALAVAGHDEARFLAALPIAAGATILAAPQSGIDLSTYQAAPLPVIGPGAGFVFAADGAMLEPDDVAVLAAAMKIAGRQLPDTRLLVAAAHAPAATRGALLAVAADVPSISVIEGGDGLTTAIRQGHAYVHGRQQAGLSSALLAALAMGRPIVASDVAGVREAVDQIVNGVLAKPGDPAALAEAMMALARRSDILPAMAAASRRKAERRFDARDVNANLLGAIGVPVALGSVA